MAQSKSNPPQVPSGWKAVFDDEYQTWYYVDLSTNSSQWEPPRGTTWPRPKGPPPGVNNEKSSRQKADQAPPPYSSQSTPQVQARAQAQQPRYYQPQQPQYPQYPQQQRYYPQQAPMPAAAPQQAYHGSAPSTSKGSGHGGAMMGGLLGVGAGLLGGAMLEHAFDDHNYDGPDTVVVENNYYGDDAGGFDGGFDDGFDGGDF
ncbi:BAH_G0016630.mRNA.1.CDS.1 [Saccharomyces cerevisiae]|nr:SX2_G0050030.mRNA.1.CDS.1 [Saccharomyces cerevisiae]CAI4454488.1 BAG_1a_G0016760.mRNA.1.CDS.1 [Saccharomyces cerevisiae]CAI4457105.1 BAH_G0016630.mRNA.1.CDS.1 [Saccharomyces cerevisiae]CAI7112957.1 BAH_G0016630.mRNA.1.CDS.1 [Saccharomyces cerevisiae]CAI7113209.1 BAG_1a_G0016760.mRNA.1.CDS.1 [Saccharomyces cerevisiae]